MNEKTRGYLLLASIFAASTQTEGDILPKGALSQRKLKRIPVYKEGEPIARTKEEKAAKKRMHKKKIKRKKKRGY